MRTVVRDEQRMDYERHLGRIVFGGPSPEHEISILTGLQSERVLTQAGETVLPLYWAPAGGWFLVPERPRRRTTSRRVPEELEARSMCASVTSRGST
jgi:D-alanine-D-alanine ligase-like ATP-grasp enzyme